MSNFRRRLMMNIKGVLTKITGVPPFLFYNSKGKKLNNYTIYGNSIQDGEPTPENKVEIQSVGEKTKNFFDLNKVVITEPDSDKISEILPNGFIVYHKYANGYTSYTYTAEKDITITFSYNAVIGKGDGYVPYVWGRLNDKFYYNIKSGKVFTLKKGDVLLLYFAYNYSPSYSKTGEESAIFTNIQLEEGDIATEYEPYGYRISIKVRGKNLLDKNMSQIGYAGAYIIRNGYTFGGVLWSDLPKYTGQSSDWYVTNPIPIKPDTIYSYSGLQLANNPAYFFLEEDKTTIIEGAAIRNSATFTTPSNARYIVMSIRSDVLETMMLQEGKITEYEPYVEPVTTNIYLKEPLRRIGEYADYIDFKTQKVIRHIKEKILNGSESWNVYSSSPGKYYFSVLKEGFKVGSSGLCSHFSWIQGASANGQCYLTGNGTTYHNFFLKEETLFPTKNDLLAFLKENNVKFITVLETSNDTETIELPDILIAKGTNIITVDTTIEPSNMEVEYWR